MRPYLIPVGLLYTLVGYGTGELARAFPPMGNLWRFAGWALSFVVFGAHLWYERRRLAKPAMTAALHVAIAVALGAFVLAIVGPVRSHWGADDFAPAALLSLLLWPIVTAVPAFIVALFAGSLLGRTALKGSA
jgi:hypothetical protein